ncbi:MAG: hypothetical protein WCY06_07310 [Flavobacteriaceae bacterium]
MSIKYFNINSIEIDSANLAMINYFYKVHYDNDSYFLKIETYEDNELTHLDYFVKDELLLNQVFEEYYYLDVIIIHFVKETKGQYLMCETFDYVNKIKSSNKRIETYRNDIVYPIYSCVINEFGKKETKYYYDIKNNIEYEFDYDENGNFKCLTILDPLFFYDTDDYTIYPEQIGIGKNYFNFSFDKFEFYKKVNPIIPLD